MGVIIPCGVSIWIDTPTRCAWIETWSYKHLGFEREKARGFDSHINPNKNSKKSLGYHHDPTYQTGGRWKTSTRLMATKFFGFTLAIKCLGKKFYSTVHHLTSHLWTQFFIGQGCATNSSLIRQIRDRSYWYGNLQQQSGKETHSQIKHHHHLNQNPNQYFSSRCHNAK